MLLIMFVFAFLLLFTVTDNFSYGAGGPNRYKINNNWRNYSEGVKLYTWKCQEYKCVKILAENANERISQATCNMVCSIRPPVWPKPQSFLISNKAISIIETNTISFDLPGQGILKNMLQNASDLFIKNLDDLKPSHVLHSDGIDLTVSILIQSHNVTKLTLKTNENYDLLIRREERGLFVYISAQNYFGARHGLETLSQLIWYDDVSDRLLILHDVDLSDYPKFPYRGLMIDTARNYFPVYQLKKIVDGMSMAKLNVLHLHLTDAQSFPIILPRQKKLAEYGAYGPKMVYTADDIRNLVQYARIRGVRLILEVDTPSHVNAGWNYAKDLYDEDYVICNERDPLNGHLNPDNPNALKVVESIYKDLLNLSENEEMFHIGSDEVDVTCWKKTEAARNFTDLKYFWSMYVNQILDKLRNANNGKFPDYIIMWSSPLTESIHLKKISGNIVVQFWLGKPTQLLDQGYSIIYSTVNNWYLDCGFGPWKPSKRRGVCDPFTPWQQFYQYRPWQYHGHRELTLGGEVCLWSEEVEIDTLETRVWPRSAAFAERVWNDPDQPDMADTYERLAIFREKMTSRGIKTSAIWPRWCTQNSGKC